MTSLDYVKEMARCIGYLDATYDVMDVQFSFTTSIQIIGGIQLCLRHPELPPYIRQTFRQLRDAWIKTLEEKCPEIGPLLRLGDVSNPFRAR